MIIMSKALFHSFFLNSTSQNSYEKFFLLMCAGLKSYCKESFDFPHPTKKMKPQLNDLILICKRLSNFANKSVINDNNFNCNVIQMTESNNLFRLAQRTDV